MLFSYTIHCLRRTADVGQLKYPAILILMTILFGLSFIATKQALTGMGIFQVVFARHALALLLLVLILWQDPQKFTIARSDWKSFLILTMVEPIGYFIFETYGLRYTSPAHASIIIATIPIFSLLFAVWIIDEKTSWLGILGILLSLGGVYFIISFQQKTFLAPHPVLGNLLALGAAISAGLYNVLCRRLSQKYSPWTITFYQSVVASLFFGPLALVEGLRQTEIIINREIVFSIIYLAIGSSIIAYYLLNYSLSRLHTSRVAVFSNLIPVVTIVASWIIYGELLSFPQLGGAALVISGIYLTFYKRHGPTPA